ncbi:hypothetical protein H0H81_002809 [Sphagnurus paluster]|uniref:Uncharacterized protein n=1 Tax=Sphagnurus paluster TaxID=117069 RepID=A0A9P7GNB6_9AGAR|nr:hypothetical protein H0H81_002809 [Sphagnurus paluster]
MPTIDLPILFDNPNLLNLSSTPHEEGDKTLVHENLGDICDRPSKNRRIEVENTATSDFLLLNSIMNDLEKQADRSCVASIYAPRDEEYPLDLDLAYEYLFSLDEKDAGRSLSASIHSPFMSFLNMESNRVVSS